MIDNNILPEDDAEEFLTGSIDDYLLSIADGIYVAQKSLSRLRVESIPGQPPTTYYLPKVDFELKLSFEMSRHPLGAEATQTGRSRMLRARTITPSDPMSQEFKTEAASTISGSFVAVPADAGKPPPLIRTIISKMNDYEYSLTAQVHTTLGDPIVGVETSFNIDREASNEKNAKAGIPETSRWLKLDTELSDGVVNTDNNGVAATNLNISTTEATGAYIVITLDALDVTESIICRVGN